MMFKKLRRKLHSKKGETFVEILVAILVVAFGCSIIAAMYSAAMSLNVEASKQDDEFYQAITDMEENGSAFTESGKAVIHDNERNKDMEKTIYIGGNEDHASYERH